MTMCNSSAQDSRVILLGKALTLSKRHFQRQKSDCDPPLLSLGFFDSLQIIPLTEVDWLQGLWKESIKLSGDTVSESYYHPLYVVAPPYEKVPDSFWEIRTQFLFVTLVHFSVESDLTKMEQFSRVSEFIRSITFSPDELAKDSVCSEVCAACYQSLNLSDMIVIWKSNSLLTLMNRLYQLYKNSDIGDLRTICSFPFPQKFPLISEEEKIPYVSFSFGVRNSGAVAEFTQLVRKKCPWWPEQGGYFTTGARDLDIVFLNLSTHCFLDVVSLWFHDPEINAYFQKAFYESSTHLGIWNDTPQEPSGKLSALEGSIWESPEENASFLKDTQLTKTCVKLFDDFQILRKICRQFKRKETSIELSWCKAVSSQLNALVDMSRICVLDGFCYLILDGADTFLQLVRPYLEENRKLPADLVARIQRFVRGWGTLLDQAVRVDGQFIQNPGFSPVLYDIPVELLEFYIAFASRCMSLLQSLDPEEKRHHYALFLLPKLCRRTKVQNIFHNPPPSDRLLYVDIPLDILYSPMQVLPQLSHEISHFCGEDFRQRNRRAQLIILACAHLAAWHFRLGNRDTVKQIYRDISAEIPQEGRSYKQDLLANVQDFFVHLPQRYELLQKWQETYLCNIDWRSEKEKVKWKHDNTYHIRNICFGRNAVLWDIGQDIRRIFKLFEEGYADISMIFLLSLSWEEYISLYEQEFCWPEESVFSGNGRNSSYAEFVQRAALVLLATGCPAPASFSGTSLPTDLKPFSQHISSLCDVLREESSALSFAKAYPQMSQNCFPVDLLLDIKDYLEECYQKMLTSAVNKKETKDIRYVFQEVARKHRVGCDGYYETLMRYEKSFK